MDESKVEEKTVIVCIICGKQGPPYKCPKCYARYCSVNCCKAHKSNGACELSKQTESEQSEESDRNYCTSTKDMIPREKLIIAQESNKIELKNFLEEPVITSNLLKLNVTRDPINKFENVMQDEKFVQFVTDQLSNSNVTNGPLLNLNLE